MPLWDRHWLKNQYWWSFGALVVLSSKISLRSAALVNKIQVAVRF
jgi:hypothetical protein